MLKDSQIVELTTPKLREMLGPLGFDHVEARSGYDQGGDPVVYMTAFHKTATRLDPGIFIDAVLAVNDVLRQHGDDRFVHLGYRSPDDEFATDDEDE